VVIVEGILAKNMLEYVFGICVCIVCLGLIASVAFVMALVCEGRAHEEKIGEKCELSIRAGKIGTRYAIF